jgi:hypothetical protein
VGSSYVTGYFGGTSTFGSTTLTSKLGSEDVFVAKLDSTGKWMWAVSAGGTGTAGGLGISVDSAGNSYVTGDFGFDFSAPGTASFGSTTLTSNGKWDVFVAKLDSTGKWLWAVSAGAGDDDFGRGISVDGAGISYITGSFDGTASFGSTTLTSKGSEDLFVWKVNKP